MKGDDTTPIERSQPWRAEGPLRLNCWATEEGLALGLAAAREVFAARGVAPGYAGVCSVAVSAYEGDPSLPEPDAHVRAADAALQEAADAAILAAGGMLKQDNHLQVSQGPEDRQLWNTLTTLRAWRIMNAPGSLDKD